MPSWLELTIYELSEISAGLGVEPLPGRGKSGSTRTLLATRFAGTLYFLFGFEKKDRDNITQRELGIYQSLASTLVVLSNDQIEAALKANELMEVQHEPND